MDINQEEEPFELNLEELSKLSVQELIENAEEQVGELNYNRATALYEYSLSKYPENDDLICSYGFFLSEKKDFVQASNYLTKSIEQNPESNPKKYLHIAQLYNGEQAIKQYQRGIDLLLKQNNVNGLEDIRMDLSQAYSAIAEIYLTDLVETPNSFQNAKLYLEKALNIDPQCIDAFYQLADLALNNNEKEIAKKYLKDIVNFLQNSENQEYLEKYTHEFKMSVVRLLVEVENYSDAVILLQDVLEDDENNPEFLYFLAFSHFHLKNYSTSLEFLHGIQLHIIQTHDPELYTATLELQQELNKYQPIDQEQEQDQEHSWVTDDDQEEDLNNQMDLE